MRHRGSIRDAVAPAVKTLLMRAGSIDLWISRRRPILFRESSGIVIPVFHAILPPRVVDHGIDPSYAVTTEQLADALEYFTGRGFIPIGLPQLVAGVDPGRNYVMFTFDDGYANNRAGIDMLEAAGVPALLSVNLALAQAGESFWWDVLYRELHKSGASLALIDRERARLIAAEPAAIRAELVGRFGVEALSPYGEHDRPFSVAELQELARRPTISFANHTSDHRLLRGRDHTSVMASLLQTQQQLTKVIGAAPLAVTYPYGLYDEVTLECCRALDFQVGFTGAFGKARLPDSLRGRDRLLLPRCVISGDRPVAVQCESTHLDWRLSWTLRRWMRRMRESVSPPRAALP
jgi:peptidoglycan/xylan/chitin deacetylase (PgdA/CDA1 family)